MDPARYSELLYTEHTAGPGADGDGPKNTYVEALTVKDPPVLQAARLEDYSPEYWALTAAKGAAILNMLRNVVGEANFRKGLKAFLDKYSWQSVTTEDFRKVMEQVIESRAALLLHSMARIERLAGIQTRIHGVSDAEGISSGRQDQSGFGYVPHAGGFANRDGRQSRGQESSK